MYRPIHWAIIGGDARRGVPARVWASVGPCGCCTVGWCPWRGALAGAPAFVAVACAGAGAGVGAGAGGSQGGTGAVGRAGKSRCGLGSGSACVGVGGGCLRADVGVCGVRFLVGLGVAVGCGRVVSRGSLGRVSVSGRAAVVVRCRTLSLPVRGAGLPWFAAGAPVVACWWSKGVVVVLVGNAVPPAWPHGLAGGLVGRPLMVPEPPWPWMCPAAAAGPGWTRWTSWGTGTGKGSCWGRIRLVCWVCRSWTKLEL